MNQRVTRADCQALLELLNERYARHATMRIKDIQAGAANRRFQRFSVPQWALEQGEAYAFWYVIHEFTHLLIPRGLHPPAFKAKEVEILDLFDLTIERKRVYPRALYYNGERQEY